MPSVIEEFDPAEYYPGFANQSQAPPLNTITAPTLGKREAIARTVKVFLPAGLGLAMVWFGLTSTGSYFSTASRFGGWLGNLFYGLQVGTLIAMIGVVIVYDSIKRSGYL